MVMYFRLGALAKDHSKHESSRKEKDRDSGIFASRDRDIDKNEDAGRKQAV
jgi:hypothetical protein